jgi:chromosome partitioning protein
MTHDAPVRRRPIAITVFNYKGGVGKTTTSVNLAVALAALGCRTILIDLDGQGNATSSLGMTTRVATGSYNLIAGNATLAEASHHTVFPGLSVCPATDDLAGTDLELAMASQPQHQLRLRLEDAAVEADVVVIDCPPALGMLPVNALVASDWVIMPVSPEPLAREGLHKAWYNVNRIRLNLNRGLQVMGILVTLAEEAEVHDRFSESIRADFGPRVLPIKVPRDQAVLEASAKDCPVVIHDPDSAAARAYVNLAAAVHATVLAPAGIDGVEAMNQEAAVRTVVANLHAWRRE